MICETFNSSLDGISHEYKVNSWGERGVILQTAVRTT
jgi:hypothetical protein